MKKCVIYARVSTDLQQTKSQIEDLQRWANSNNFTVEKIFDESISGFITERDELENLKSYIKQHNIKQVLCFELSRLGRSTLQTLKEIEYFTKEEVNLFLKKENINTLYQDASTKLLLSVLSSINELEVSTLKIRMARGRYSSVLKGKRSGYCFLPYGFSADEEGYLVINEKESIIIKEIFDMYINGIPMRRIAMNLNSKGIPTRHTTVGKKRVLQNGESFKILWRNNSIYTILKNRLYKGERNYKSEIIKVPQIIDTETWNKVQEMLKNNIGYVIRTKYNYLFKTKLICGHCNYTFGTRIEKRYPNQPAYYFCNGKYDLTIHCKSGQFNSNFIDEILYKSMFIYSLTKETQQYFNQEQKSNINIDEKNKQLLYFKGEIDVINAKKKRVNSMFKDGYISENEFKKEQATLRNDLIDVENNIKQIENFIKKYKDVNIYNILKAGRDETDFNTQYEYVQKYCDKAIVYPVENYDKKTLSKCCKIWENAKKIGTSLENDKVFYIELYAFNNPNPIKIILTSWTKLWRSENYIGFYEFMMYDKKTKTLNFNPKNILDGVKNVN